MVYVVALARADSCQGTELLSRLLGLEEGRITWHSLDAAEAKTLLSFAYRHSQELLEPIAAKLDDELFTLARPEQDDPALDGWLRLALQRVNLWHDVAVELQELSLAFPEPEDIVRISSGEATEPVVRSLQQTLLEALADGNPGAPRIALLLRQLNMLFYCYTLEPDEQLLGSLQTKLDRLTIPALAFAAAIMRRKPTAAMQSALGLAWLRIVEGARVKLDDPTRSIPANLCLAADEVAVALGACIACDPEYHGFEADEELFQPVKRLRGEEQPLLDKRNELLNRRKELLDTRKEIEGEHVHQFFPEALRNLPEARPIELRSLDEKVFDCEAKLDELLRRIKEAQDVSRANCSPGYLLLDTLRDLHGIAIPVRQAAARGLDVLQLDGNLNTAALQTVQNAISTAIDAQGPRFRERWIHAPVQSSRSEILEKIEEGLNWMDRIGAASAASAPCTPDSRPDSCGASGMPLRDLVGTMCEWVPNAVKFLERYPLRIMIPNDTGILGDYVMTGATIQQWTSSTPPLNSGRVVRRFLELDDRSLPNSMGIDYRLFQHPVLLLPTLYHEYLHHAGVPENDNRPIPNEAEVRIRESLFSRGLVAALAPEDDRDLPAYERSILHAIREIDVGWLLFLLADFAKPHILELLNRTIYEAYGGGFGRQRAEKEADRRIEEKNAQIKSANEGLTWDPWIRWPFFESKDTEQITADYREILVRSASQVNTVDESALESILEEESSRLFCRQWRKYCQREGSLAELIRAVTEHIPQ